MNEKEKFPLSVARRLALKVAERLKPLCDRIEVVGSVRRGKERVGDMEVLYIPRFAPGKDVNDLFGLDISVNLVDATLEQWLAEGLIVKRPKVDGSMTWGQWIKLARSTATGIPMDFFATDMACWWNQLVCRTGSKENNMRIAAAALAQGREWHPLGPGFSQKFASMGIKNYPMHSEREVFEFVGLPYLEPSQR